MSDLTFHNIVVHLLNEAGVQATLEYPALVFIELDARTMVATGLNGWDYGSVSVLEDGTWEPIEGDDCFEVPIPGYDYTDPNAETPDAETITKAWVRAVHEWREASK